VLTNAYVLPALLSLREAHPDLVPVMGNMTPADANQALVRGEIDAAFYYDPLTHDALSIDRIGQATASVYCGRGHPLFGRKRVSMKTLQAHPFSVPAIGDRGVSMDGWPVEVPRQIGMHITLLTTNVEVSLGGQMLTVLPDVAAYAHVAQDKLHRLPLEIVPPVQLFAARRATDTVEGASTAVVDAVAAQVVKVDVAVAAALAKGRKS